MTAGRDKILLVGLFVSPRNKHLILRTAADQLAELFEKNGLETIKASSAVNQAARFLHTNFVILSKLHRYQIAVVPLYGTPKSFFGSSIATLLLKLLNKKIILILHGGSIPERMEANSAKFVRVMKRADAVVCPSAYLQAVVKKHGIESRLVENVISSRDYVFNDKQVFRPRLFWMRTFHNIYNPEMAVRVAALLAKRYPDFKMVMAGYDRGALAATKQLVKELGLTDKISLPGYISNEEKNQYAREYDIYLCTNRIDNAPVSVIEMMSLGLPVVSVNTGGLPYLIKEGETGGLVNMDDNAAMAKAIAEIIDHPAFGKKLALNALKFAGQFSEAPVMAKWNVLLHELQAPLVILRQANTTAI